MAVGLGHVAKPRWTARIERVAISVVTVEEVLFGLARKPNEKIHDWFTRFFVDACDIIPVTGEIAERSGIMRGELRAAGITQSQADSLIAATAQVHGLTLVTRSVRDFSECRIEVLNPFV